MALEALVRVPSVVADGWLIDHGQLSLLPLFARLAEPGIDRVEAAECFHGTLIAALGDWVCRTADATGIRLVALSGGCLLNRVLAEGLVATLRARGLKPLLARRLPPNDGAISLGQAAVAAIDSANWTQARQSQGEPAR
jgi:hydrogenase maturation protein HypF